MSLTRYIYQGNTQSISVILLIILLGFFTCFGQDTTFQTKLGSVELYETLRFKTFDVVGKRTNKTWISGKVRRVDYDYMYVRTYQGSTQPANPASFYKPIKRKSFYYVPIDDVIIKYSRSNQVFQVYCKDSNILRSYYEDGAPRDVYFFNNDLQVDSLYQFYENGNLKTKILGASNRMKRNLHLGLWHTPEMVLRTSPRGWAPKNRRYANHLFKPNYPDYTGVSYPIVQYYCHGNGNPQLKIKFAKDQDSLMRKSFEFYDLEGNPSDSANIASDGAWTGVQYNYFESGNLQSRKELYRDRVYSKQTLWNMDGSLRYSQYYRKGHLDSTVLYKQLKDTLFTWSSPMHFEWYSDTNLRYVKHAHCNLEFNPNGTLRQYSFKGFSRYTDSNPSDEKLKLEHFGEMDELGLPHGRFYGVNKSNDTIYDINYRHGWLHGEFKVNVNYWPSNWSRSYDMGLEKDSSIRYYKGTRNQAIYYSAPGKIAKKVQYFADGRVNQVDTVFHGTKSICLKRVHFDDWFVETSIVDTTEKLVHTKVYFAPDSLKLERSTDYYGNLRILKEYDMKTGVLKSYWKYGGTEVIETGKMIEKYDEEGIFIAMVPQQKLVQLATRLIYDRGGKLLTIEKLRDREVVE